MLLNSSAPDHKQEYEKQEYKPGSGFALYFFILLCIAEQATTKDGGSARISMRVHTSSTLYIYMIYDAKDEPYCNLCIVCLLQREAGCIGLCFDANTTVCIKDNPLEEVATDLDDAIDRPPTTKFSGPRMSLFTHKRIDFPKRRQRLSIYAGF